jgi:hypothetical protein
MLAYFAPSYLWAQGFPLDDAWIHAVYGRSIATELSFSYNPGEPSTGATSLMWAVFLALPHLVASDVSTIVLLIKTVGFTCHVITSLLVFLALQNGEKRTGAAIVGAMLVGIHPDLVAGAVSGMEVPLTSLTLALALWTVSKQRWLAFSVVAAFAPLVRPELGAISISLTAGLFFTSMRRFSQKALAGATVGNLIAFGIMAARNLSVSGLPLPATFYAKVTHADASLIANAVSRGSALFLSQFPITDALVLVLVAAIFSVAALLAGKKFPLLGDMTLYANVYCSGILLVVTEIVLMPVADPTIFYHQRYVLPALLLLLAATPGILTFLLARVLKGKSMIALCTLLIVAATVSIGLDSGQRYRRMSNDTRNIDDVQVRVGKKLSNASVEEVAWAVDAGAVRYFGNTYVVDLMGLNSVAMLGPNSQLFLNQHKPNYLDYVPGWVNMSRELFAAGHATQFKPSTPYTVTNFKIMASHYLIECSPHVTSDQFIETRLGRFQVECAGKPEES